MAKVKKRFVNRDLSWLTFNCRVLDEAAKESVPLLERLKFLAIYSANLDEFYRVRIPVLMALKALKKKNGDHQVLPLKKGLLKKVKKTVGLQQEYFGAILQNSIIPALRSSHIHLLYNVSIPPFLREETQAYFFHTIAAHLEIIYPESLDYFPKNNQLYLAVAFAAGEAYSMALVNIPSNLISRFLTLRLNEHDYVLFIDDILKDNLAHIFPNKEIIHAYSFKVTRDAELDIQDEFTGDIAHEIEQLLRTRDNGIATRFLYAPDIPENTKMALVQQLQLEHATQVAGGNYHHLRDFFSFPIQHPELKYPLLPAVDRTALPCLFNEISAQDILLHTPYDSYNTVLRFFNEAVINPAVTEIFTTMYRVASDSRIIHALINASRNGKKVTVFVELKARFDEANNIKWARQMEAASVQIIYSTPKLKVHAKVALIRLEEKGKSTRLALFSTGNLNENTASSYTDHTLLTASPELTAELSTLFSYLSSSCFSKEYPPLGFKHLLVAQFNLLAVFSTLIDNEINHALKGKPASITIKINNLEDEGLINKLYEANQAGVRIRLIVRSICSIRPGVKGLSEHINVIRIVDRFLEHGRIFIFHNQGEEKIFLGSADWMERNIYRRIEVCFPLYEPALKKQIKAIIDLQLSDDLAAVTLDQDAQNIAIEPKNNIQSQEAIFKLIVQQRVATAVTTAASNAFNLMT